MRYMEITAIHSNPLKNLNFIKNSSKLLGVETGFHREKKNTNTISMEVFLENHQMSFVRGFVFFNFLFCVSSNVVPAVWCYLLWFLAYFCEGCNGMMVLTAY